jgi:hypothetical protein
MHLGEIFHTLSFFFLINIILQSYIITFKKEGGKKLMKVKDGGGRFG